MRLTIAAAALACVSLLASPAYAQPKATADIKDASGKLRWRGGARAA
jgi:hypothetical protein